MGWLMNVHFGHGQFWSCLGGVTSFGGIWGLSREIGRGKEEGGGGSIGSGGCEGGEGAWSFLRVDWR